jgi:hypothetical protein
MGLAEEALDLAQQGARIRHAQTGQGKDRLAMKVQSVACVHQIALWPRSSTK